MRFDAKFTAVLAVGVLSVSLLGGQTAHAESKVTDATSSQTTAQAKSDGTKPPDQKPVAAPQPKVVTVQPGDSLSKIADSEQTTWVRIFDNNADISDPNIIQPGEKVTIPLVDQQLPDRYGALTAAQVAAMPVASTAAPAPTQQVTPGAQPVAAARSAAAPTAGGANAYTWGECTWYVKNMRPDIGSYWGNAGYSWISEARAAGFATGSAPQAGAIAVEGGHVAYVQSASGGMVSISEMNYAGGVGRVHYRTVSAGEFQYIY